MTDTAQRLKEELEKLPESDRAELAAFLFNTLDTEADEDTEAAWDAELERRSQEIHKGDAVGFPVDEVLAELRERLK
jgi:putative addiction module component (TIGR02574 family)